MNVTIPIGRLTVDNLKSISSKIENGEKMKLKAFEYGEDSKTLIWIEPEDEEETIMFSLSKDQALLLSDALKRIAKSETNKL